MKEVHRANDPAEAHLLCGMLQSEGIEATVTGELAFGTRGEAPLDLSTLPAIVISDDSEAVRAAKLIHDYKRGKGPAVKGEDWSCSGCQEDIEGQFSTCWNCGADRK